ncbi:MAG: PP2C family protein-serine/threonine phosphatase [Silvibacterium sp.]
MASNSQTPWYLRTPKQWQHFQAVPFSRLRLLLIAVFALFSTFGFFADIMNGGRDPYVAVLANAVLNGLQPTLWILILARLPLVYLSVAFTASVINAFLTVWLGKALPRVLGTVDGHTGIQFAAIATMVAIMISYVFFVAFIRSVGKVTIKLQNELELAHGIQQTLVPPFMLRTVRFEIYGISKPSEKVGGDLVDALLLSNGDAIAYLGDIAGHGLQAGILMGMLKTATRTALLDAGEREPSRTLPVLLDRLNTVLPSVKEAHMYATFSAFRLCADGAVFYALAASPPILHWHASGTALSKVEVEQFPLGLLPVPEFDGQQLEMATGDLLVVATDGILEACDKREEEYGVERLKQTIATHARTELPELAAKILDAANNFGKQVDDQTILLIRCV